jgi:Hydrolase of X-linked nucleoside diphosphate N terminal
VNADPAWLNWVREMQAIAQTGLAFVRDPYDAERYRMLRNLAARIAATHTGDDRQHVEKLFAGEQGYATPKVDVRGAVFDSDGRILLVREVVDDGRWTLPGGWCARNPVIMSRFASSQRCGIERAKDISRRLLSPSTSCFLSAR